MVKYYFVQWEDGDKHNSRTINVTADMTFTATYSTTPELPPSFLDYVVESKGLDRFTADRIEMWHGNDFVTLKPGIVIHFILNRRLVAGGPIVVVEEKDIAIKEQITITNIEGTAEYPGDWNIILTMVGYLPLPPPCFIATVAYGSPLANELNVLRRFRNQCLPSLIVNTYYEIGPYLAQLIKTREHAKRYTREVLNIFVKVAQKLRRL